MEYFNYSHTIKINTKMKIYEFSKKYKKITYFFRDLVFLLKKFTSKYKFLRTKNTDKEIEKKM